MKPITKQLTISAFILASVTVLSFGIRQVRFSIHRANTAENPVVADTGETTPARSLNREKKFHSRQPLGANAESDHYLADSYTIDDERDLQYADVSDWDDQASSEAHTDSVKRNKAVSKTKSFKGDYGKAEGKKDLEKISLSDNENLYITEKGEAWYVSKEADGSTTKMQVKIDDRGDMNIVDGGNYAKSGGSQRISVGDREDLYLTEEGETWYVSEQPDGSTAKVQLETEDIHGKSTIIDSGKN